MILLLLYLLSGGPENAVLNYLSAVQDQVNSAVLEPARRDLVSQTLSEMAQRNTVHHEATGKRLEQLLSALKPHSANENAITTLLDQQSEALTQYNSDMIDLRFDLREALSREEWNALFGSDN